MCVLASLQNELWAYALRGSAVTRTLAGWNSDPREPLWVKLLVVLVMLLFGLMFLTLFGFISYSFGHWILSIFRWFHTRHVARFGQAGMATLVAKRSSLMTTRGDPLTLVVTLEFRSPDGIMHRRELLKSADVADLPEVGSHYKIFYDPAHPDDFVMKDAWISQSSAQSA